MKAHAALLLQKSFSTLFKTHLQKFETVNTTPHLTIHFVYFSMSRSIFTNTKHSAPKQTNYSTKCNPQYTTLYVTKLPICFQKKFTPTFAIGQTALKSTYTR